MKAVVEFAFPANMSKKRSLSSPMVQSGFSKVPCPADPAPDFKSMNQSPSSAPGEKEDKNSIINEKSYIR